jgi:uncharacterized protein (TIRG00374 family)
VLAGNFINYIIPIRAGEIAKAYFYKQNHNINWSSSLPSIFIDKVFDTFVIVFLLMLLPFTGISLAPVLKNIMGLVLFVLLACVAFLIVATIKEQLVTNILKKVLFFLPSKIKEKVLIFFHNCVEGIVICQHKKRVIPPCFVYTVLATVLEGLYFFMIFKAFGIELGFLNVLFGYTLIFLSYVLPQPPAQIGTNELMMHYVFALGFGLAPDKMASVMALSHVFTAIIISTTGSISIVHSGFRLMDINLLRRKINENR